MSRLSSEPKIISLANSLRLKGGDPVDAILDYCRKQVAKIWRSSSAVRTILDLERLVCDRLNLIVHQAQSDADVRRISREYVAQREFVFAALDSQLDEETFGVLIQKKQHHRRDPYEYVSVIDCRGEKASRSFFTRWHEIAHCLTTVDQFELPLRRTTKSGIEKDCVEKLMDMIAGELAFFDPLFVPLLKEKISKHGKVTFDVVEEIRSEFCREASFQSTLNACVDRASQPMISLIAGLGLKANEARRLASPQIQLIPQPQPRRQLRVLNAVSNDAAREQGLRIHRNMRVPPTSIVAKTFRDNSPLGSSMHHECLSNWGCSDGTTLAPVEVEIEAKKVGGQVFAIIASLDG